MIGPDALAARWACEKPVTINLNQKRPPAGAAYLGRQIEIGRTPMAAEYSDDVLTVARVFIDRFGASAAYWAMARVRIDERTEVDAWRQVVSAIEDLQSS